MTLALFVHLNSDRTSLNELATLAALAHKVRGVGHSPVLLVGDTTGTSSVELAHGAAFDRIEAHGLTDAGDGADALRALAAEKVAAEVPQYVVALASIASRNWAPQVAARLGAEFVGSAEEITPEGTALTISAPVMGGMLRKRLTVGTKPAVLLYAGEDLASDAAAASIGVGATSVAGLKLLRSTPLPDSGIPLRGATRVVSGGLGVGSAENWPIIEKFAARVEAAVGASRAAVEMGWAPSSRQVGFSGQKVAPDVYVAIGISGAVHHLAGIAGARKIVAVNKDPEAPIFKLADLAIVGDYKNVLDAAIRRLGQG
jgi:electron transfer flavoprotein alpha subunit